MIHSARPIVTPVANIVFCCFVDLKSGDGRTDGQHVRKQWSLPAVTLSWPSGSICGRYSFVRSPNIRNTEEPTSTSRNYVREQGISESQANETKGRSKETSTTHTFSVVLLHTAFILVRTNANGEGLSLGDSVGNAKRRKRIQKRKKERLLLTGLLRSSHIFRLYRNKEEEKEGKTKKKA